jgi:hypothetical protein
MKMLGFLKFCKKRKQALRETSTNVNPLKLKWYQNNEICSLKDSLVSKSNFEAAFRWSQKLLRFDKKTLFFVAKNERVIFSCIYIFIFCLLPLQEGMVMKS